MLVEMLLVVCSVLQKWNDYKNVLLPNFYISLCATNKQTNKSLTELTKNITWRQHRQTSCHTLVTSCKLAHLKSQSCWELLAKKWEDPPQNPLAGHYKRHIGITMEDLKEAVWDRGIWGVLIHRVAKDQTQLKWLTTMMRHMKISWIQLYVLHYKKKGLIMESIKDVLYIQEETSKHQINNE